jgi:hypothetical protein
MKFLSIYKGSNNPVNNHNDFKDQIKDPSSGMKQRSTSGEEKSGHSDFRSLVNEDNLVQYLEWLGVRNDPNTLVLSGKHHFYYELEELRHINTIINLKELNQVKQIKNFIETVRYILKERGSFIGYFTDNTNQNLFKSFLDSYDSDSIVKGSVSWSPFFNMINDLMYSSTARYLSNKSVRQLLEANGFRVSDMSELDGHTYFHAQIAHPVYN